MEEYLLAWQRAIGIENFGAKYQESESNLGPTQLLFLILSKCLQNGGVDLRCRQGYHKSDASDYKELKYNILVFFM